MTPQQQAEEIRLWFMRSKIDVGAKEFEEKIASALQAKEERIAKLELRNKRLEAHSKSGDEGYEELKDLLQQKETEIEKLYEYIEQIRIPLEKPLSYQSLEEQIQTLQARVKKLDIAEKALREAEELITSEYCSHFSANPCGDYNNCYAQFIYKALSELKNDA